MAQAQFRFETKKIDISRRFGAPKVATMDGWFKQARAHIPQIPSVKDTGWSIANQSLTGTKWIRFDLQNTQGERCYLIIDREASSM